MGGLLDGVPGRPQRWGVGKVEVGKLSDGVGVVDRGREDVDPFGHLGAVGTEELTSQQLPGPLVSGEAYGELGGARVVGLVVVDIELHGERVEAGGPGLGVTETGGGRDPFEQLDRLGAQGAGVLQAAAHDVVAGDPTLLVRCGAERQVTGLVEQPVVGVGAVAGRPDTVDAGAHLAVDRDRAGSSELEADFPGEPGGGVDSRGDQDQPGPQPPTVEDDHKVAAGLFDASTVVPQRTSTSCSVRCRSMSAASSGSRVRGNNWGSCSTTMTRRLRVVRASAISSPTYPAPTMTAVDSGGSWSTVSVSAKVSGMVCSTWTPSLAPSVSRPGIGGRRGVAPVARISRS